MRKTGNGFHADSSSGSFERVSSPTDIAKCVCIVAIIADLIQTIVDGPHVFFGLFAEDLNQFGRHVVSGVKLIDDFLKVDFAVFRHSVFLSNR